MEVVGCISHYVTYVPTTTYSCCTKMHKVKKKMKKGGGGGGNNIRKLDRISPSKVFNAQMRIRTVSHEMPSRRNDGRKCCCLLIFFPFDYTAA